MRYVANKKCRISGKDYCKGDIIPSSELAVYEGAKLVRYGFLSEIPDNELTGETLYANEAMGFAELKSIMIGVPILSLDGKVLDFSAEDVAEALRVLQMSSDSAVAYVKDCQNDMVCNLLGFVDKRKGVFAALSKRSAKTETDQEDNNSGQVEITDDNDEQGADVNGGDEPVQSESVGETPEEVSDEDVNGGDE